MPALPSYAHFESLTAPRQSDFKHLSYAHGYEHVSRVLVLGQILAHAVGADERTARILWATGYLHDLARRDDGMCAMHGTWAVEEKLPGLKPFFMQHGLPVDDLEVVAEASRWHSKPKEPRSDHPFFREISLFKDSDGLDRVRLGDLDPTFLRHPAARQMVPFSESLFELSLETPMPDEGHCAAAGRLAHGLAHILPGGRRISGAAYNHPSP